MANNFKVGDQVRVWGPKGDLATIIEVVAEGTYTAGMVVIKYNDKTKSREPILKDPESLLPA